MAQITRSTLTSTKNGGIITFFVDTTMRFAPHEVGSLWQLRLQMREDDSWPNPDDNLSSSTARNFRVNNATERVQMTRRLSTGTVDTEWGDEEVYGHVTVRPLEPPPVMRADTAQTNILVVNE